MPGQFSLTQARGLNALTLTEVTVAPSTDLPIRLQANPASPVCGVSHRPCRRLDLLSRTESDTIIPVLRLERVLLRRRCELHVLRNHGAQTQRVCFHVSPREVFTLAHSTLPCEQPKTKHGVLGCCSIYLPRLFPDPSIKRWFEQSTEYCRMQVTCASRNRRLDCQRTSNLYAMSDCPSSP